MIGGFWTGSLALLADAGCMLTDVAGVGLALLAIWFAEKPASPEKTYGYYRVEILAAMTNACCTIEFKIAHVTAQTEREGFACHETHL